MIEHVSTLAGFRQFAERVDGVATVEVRAEHEGVFVQGENGFRLSIFFGYGSYSHRRNTKNEPHRNIDEILSEVEDAEIAVFGPDGEFVKWQLDGYSDDVVGYVEADKIRRLTQEVMALDSRAALVGVRTMTALTD